MRSQKSLGLCKTPLYETHTRILHNPLECRTETEGFTFNCWIFFISKGIFVNILLGCGNMPVGFFQSTYKFVVCFANGSEIGG